MEKERDTFNANYVLYTNMEIYHIDTCVPHVHDILSIPYKTAVFPVTPAPPPGRQAPAEGEGG